MSAAGEAGRREAEAGTTLLEALVVLTLMVMIGGLMFPAMERMLRSVGLSQARAAVSADLHRARALAAEGGAAVVWSASPDGASYGWTGAPPRVAGPGVRVKGSLAFYPDGSSAGPGVEVSAAPARSPG